MIRTSLLIAFFTLFSLSSVLFTEIALASDVNEIMKAVSRLCSLPAENGNDLKFEGSLGAGGIVKLIGVKGEGKLSYEEWEGIKDVLARDRIHDRKSSRDCVQNILPILLKAYGVSSQTRNELNNLLKRETAIQDHYLSDDPVRRAAAFREAFRSINIFFVDLTPTDSDDKPSSKSEGVNEKNISNHVNYYDYNTGKFSDSEPTKKQHLRGQIHGDTLSFMTNRCSGTLGNLHGTWEFTGPVTCTSFRYKGSFALR
ncbi:hypothetical protein A3194_12295 [Candidatus Thiodiazotropha endoloripes]|uniref:hypothetical protein n=1 Tax=Candidatus Thiodiazotropha endoloripes TaxID=1818881 RepID=UPI00083E3674|nr:hypothetical protein [Candidatus Thiodiazotropha endoloripes]ODB85610.1 hypothetical protein A3194_12295 [Candidatus Thiodiazotropha endoloripes]